MIGFAVVAACLAFRSTEAGLTGTGGSPPSITIRGGMSSTASKIEEASLGFDQSSSALSTTIRPTPPDANDSTKSLPEQLAVYVEAGDSFDRPEFAASLARFLQLDPDGAANFAVSLAPGSLREEALRRVAQGLAFLDSGRAEEWGANLSDDGERASALADVCLQVAQTDGGEAVRKAERHQLSEAPGALMENLVQQWAGQDFSAAVGWTLGLPPGEQREQICERLAIVLSATEPAKAARLVLEEIPQGSTQTEAVIAVLYQWASRDMDGASAWVGLFPAGRVRDRAERELSNLAAHQMGM